MRALPARRPRRAVPRLAVVAVAGFATVDLSGEFAGGGSASAKGRLAQVVYTLTQFPAITGVRFKIDGKAVTTFTDAAIDLSGAVDRMTYTDQLPAIFVDQPAWG